MTNKLVEDIAKSFLVADAIAVPFIEATIEALDGRHGWKLVPVMPTTKMCESGYPEDWAGMIADSPDPLAE